MFSLLIVIISVALVVLLVMAAAYYGGSDLLNKSSEEAVIAQGVNEVSQIQNAIFSYYSLYDKWPNSLAELTETRVMGSLPKGWSGDSEVVSNSNSRFMELRSDSNAERICSAINERLKLDTEPLAPSCNDITSSFSGCCLSNP